MQPFINAVSAVGCGQPNFFFDEEEYGIVRIHFTINRQIVSESQVRLNWLSMPLKPDFTEVIQKYSRLPFTNTKEALKMVKRATDKLENER